MRTLFLTLIVCTLVSCTKEPARATNPYAVKVADQAAPDSLLNGIEETIMNTFTQSMARGNASPMEKLVDKLDQGYQQTDQNLYRYWQAYTLFYQAIFHLQNKEEKSAEEITDQAINLLDKLDAKTSEDFALLALLQGFSIQFKSGIKAPFISGKSNKNARIAQEMNPENPRAYYVLGNNDFYTPKQFGGGKEVVVHLEKAIELAAQQPDNPYLPSWGAENAYEMLMKYYAREGQDDKLQETMDRAMKAFPGSYRLNQVIAQIEEG
jgi:hypothetical protein